MRSFPLQLWQRSRWLVVVCTVLSVSNLRAEDEGQADPVSIRRVLIPAERVPAELERVKQGVLQQLTREEFESRVKRARVTHDALRSPPRLIETRYRATFVDTALVGTAQWKIRNSGPGAGILALPSFNLAVQKSRLQKIEPWYKITEQSLHVLRADAVPDPVLTRLQPLLQRGFAAEKDYLEGLRTVLSAEEVERHKTRLLSHTKIDTTEAILGDLDGKSLGLLVEQPGEHSAYLDWTARALASPGMLRFDVRVPACALATLELTLPADRILSQRDNLLISGPHPAETAERRLWHIDFAGQSQLDLEIRAVANPAQSAPLMLASLASHQELEPDMLRADFDFEVEVPHEAVRELSFECDPALRPYEVTVKNLESWEAHPAAAANQPFVLKVRLREPFRDSSLPLQIQIRCLAPLPANKPWTSPGIRLDGALPQGESLLLRVHPLVRLDDWQSGSFVMAPFTETEISPGVRSKTAMGWQTITMTKSALKVANPARPSAVIRSQATEYRTRMLSWWQVGPQGAMLTVQAQVDVIQGHLFRLPFTMPSGWEVDRVELSPAELLRNWAVVQDNERRILAVDLQRPLSVPTGARTPASGVRLSVSLRHNQRALAGGGHLPFPDLAPVGAYLREGTLGISVDPVFQVKVDASVPASTAKVKGPWDLKGPDYVFPYRGAPLTGTLQLQPRRTLAQAHCTSEATLTPEGASLVAHLLLEPQIGNPDVLDLMVTAPTIGSWNWKTERGPNHVRSFQRLRSIEAVNHLAFLGVGPLQAAIRVAQPVPQREWWRLTLARPLREPLLLRASFSFPTVERPGSSRLLWAIPLPLVLSADPMDAEVLLHMKGVEGSSFSTQGSLEMPANAVQARTSVWRTFRYGAAPAALSVQGKRSPLASISGLTATPVVERALLAITVEPEGRLLHHYRFQVSHWKQPTFPLRLPPGARCLEVKVDGGWLGRIDRAITENGAETITVPCHAGLASHQYEIIYETTTLSWKIWTAVSAPAPELPVEALSFRRVWRLPPGMMPLYRENLQRFPGPAGPPPLLWDAPPTPADQARSFELQTPASLTHATLSGLTQNEWAIQQQLDLGDAVAAYQNQPESRTLGNALEYMFFDYLKGKETLVVDVSALRGRGITPGTPLPRREQTRRPTTPPWAEIGLAVIPGRYGPILTTQNQLDHWLGLDRPETVAQTLEAAVRQAITHRHDQSGRFQSLSEWLADTDVGQGRELNWLAGPYDAGLNWTEWEAHAGTDTERLEIVRQDAIPMLGLAVAFSMVWLVWRIRRWRHWQRLTLLIAWLTIAGLTLLRLPESLRGLAWYPLLFALATALFGYLRTISLLLRRKATPGAAVTLGLLIVFVPALSGQMPQTFTVFLLPASEESPQKQLVLAPPELLKQFDEMASAGSANPTSAIALAAQYDGQATAIGAEFKAEFRVHCFADQASFSLPLAGVQLMPDVLVDGAKAHPRALELPREGYVLDIKGIGTHVVTLRFHAPITASGDDRTVRFAIPEVVQSRLLMDVPVGSRFLSALLGRGRQVVTPEVALSAQADKPLKLEADLGRVGLINVRWRQEAKPATSANLQVREAYLWRLHPSTSSLLAVLQYAARPGAPTTLVFDLPENLEIRSADASRLPGAPVDEPLPRLKNWDVTGRGQQRRLLLEFQRPISAGVQIVAEFIPRQPFGPTAVLPLPTPQQTRTSEGFLAYQLEGVRAQVAEHLRVNGIDAKVFLKNWRAAGMSDPGVNLHAYTFQRAPGIAPYLRLNLSPLPSELTCVQNVTWTVDTRQADLAIQARLTAPGRDLALAEWQVPPAVQGLEITGPDIRSWSRNGPRVQIWLHRAVGNTDIRITGWQSLEPLKGKTAAKSGETLTYALRLAPIGMLGTRSLTTHVHIQALDDLLPTPLGLANLAPTPDTKPSEREVDLFGEQVDIAGLVQVRRLLMRADARTLTLLELLDNQLTFNTVIDWQVRQGELRTLKVRLQNWPGEEVEIVAPGVIQQRELPRDATARSWTLMLPDGISGNYRLKVSGKLHPSSLALSHAASGSGKNSLPVPDVSVEGATVQERWLAVAGSELRAEAPRGLTPVSDPVQVLRAWPAEAERIRRAGSAWKIQASDWQLRLKAASADADATPFRVLLAQHQSAMLDGKRWLHQSTYWLYQDSGADLVIQLPAGARLQSLFVDGAEIVQFQPSPQRFWLPLSGLGGARTLRIRWYADPASESISRPSLQAPQLEGVPPGPAQWLVHAPPGYQVIAKDARPDSASDQDLRRAEALLQLSTLLAERLRGRIEGPLARQMTEAQEAFYGVCRQVELRGAGERSSISDVRERNLNLAKSHGFEDVRAAAERQARSFTRPKEPDDDDTPDRPQLFQDEDLPSDQGTPTAWQGAAADTPPELEVISVQKQRQVRSLEWSALFLMVLVGAGAISFFPRLLAWSRFFWPEQMMLLGYGSALAWGPGWIALFLMVFGAIGRLIVLAQWTVIALRQVGQILVPPEPGAGSTG